MSNATIIFLLTICIVILVCIIVYQQFVFHNGTKAKIHEISSKLKELLDTGSDEKVTVFTDNRALIELATQINRMLEDRQKVKVEYRRTEMASKKMLSILENVFAQIIKANGFSLNYFESKKYGELDFVIQNGMKVDLLEIKSGNDYQKHSALNKVSAVENWDFGRKIVFCKGNVMEKEGIEYYPWYLSMFYQQEKEPERFIYEVDLAGL